MKNTLHFLAAWWEECCSPCLSSTTEKTVLLPMAPWTNSSDPKSRLGSSNTLSRVSCALNLSSPIRHEQFACIGENAACRWTAVKRVSLPFTRERSSSVHLSPGLAAHSSAASVF